MISPRRALLNSSISGQQYQLLDWLKEVTFPTEARFKNLEYACETYEQVVTRVINNGVRVLPRF